MKQMNKQPIFDGKMTEQSIKNTDQLIFSRQLGYQSLMKGLAQWRILESEEQQCWICNNSIQTIVFWQESYGWKNADIMDL